MKNCILSALLIISCTAAPCEGQFFGGGFGDLLGAFGGDNGRVRQQQQQQQPQEPTPQSPPPQPYMYAYYPPGNGVVANGEMPRPQYRYYAPQDPAAFDRQQYPQPAATQPQQQQQPQGNSQVNSLWGWLLDPQNAAGPSGLNLGDGKLNVENGTTTFTNSSVSYWSTFDPNKNKTVTLRNSTVYSNGTGGQAAPPQLPNFGIFGWFLNGSNLAPHMAGGHSDGDKISQPDNGAVVVVQETTTTVSTPASTSPTPVRSNLVPVANPNRDVQAPKIVYVQAVPVRGGYVPGVNNNVQSYYPQQQQQQQMQQMQQQQMPYQPSFPFFGAAQQQRNPQYYYNPYG